MPRAGGCEAGSVPSPAVNPFQPPRRRLLNPRTLLLAIAGAAFCSVAAAATGNGHGEDPTRFLVAFSVILVAAKVAGEIFERLNQPTVLGELLCGIVLGNLSLLGLGALDTLVDAPFLAIAAEVGVILLLFEVGLEADLEELLAVGPSAALVALVGVAAPMLMGFGASWLFMPEDAEWFSHLFVGATLSATSVGITARVLKDIGRTRARESRIILGAAIVDDILGLLVLAFVLGIVHSADTAGGTEAVSLLPILLILLQAVGFLALSLLIGRLLIVHLITVIQKAKSKSVGIVMSVAYCFMMAALAELIGLADIVGAFTAGLVIDDAMTRHYGGHPARMRVATGIRPISAVFVPVFFVYMGMRVDVMSFAFADVLIFAAVLSMVAVVSKQVCSLGVLEPEVNRWAVGVGMIPRGEVGLIFAGVGSTVMVSGAPVFGAETFSSVVAMVMVTTLATPPLLKMAFARLPASEAPEGK